MWKLKLILKVMENLRFKNPNKENILDIYSYFYKHASDSPTPAKCK